jgi:hypothetical protein
MKKFKNMVKNMSIWVIKNPKFYADFKMEHLYSLSKIEPRTSFGKDITRPLKNRVFGDTFWFSAGATIVHVHCALCIVQCAVCSVHCALCIVQCAVCIVHCALCIVHCALCIVHCALCIVHCAVCSPSMAWPICIPLYRIYSTVTLYVHYML